MMNLATFWSLIDQSKQSNETFDMNGQGDALMALLTKEDTSTKVAFQKRLEALQKELTTPKAMEVTQMMNYGGTDYVFKGFANWVIALGEDHYSKAKESPDYLLSLEDPKLFVVGRAYLQDLNHVASGAFYEKMGLDADWDEELLSYRKQQRERELKINQKGLDRE